MDKQPYWGKMDGGGCRHDRAKKVAVVACPGHTFDTFFALAPNAGYPNSAEDMGRMRRNLAERGCELRDWYTAGRDCEAVVFINWMPVDVLKEARNKRWIYLGMEPTVGIQYHTKFRLETISRHVDAVVAYLRAPFRRDNIFRTKGSISLPDSRDTPLPDSFANRKLVCLIGLYVFSRYRTSCYHLRQIVADFFDRRHPEAFDLFGAEWEKFGYGTWRGRANDKAEIYGKYRFAFAFDNDTETMSADKLFDCFKMGVVPIGRYAAFGIPGDVFIDYDRFDDLEDLYAFLTSVGEEEWLGYIRRGRDFLKSEQASEYEISKLENLLYDLVFAGAAPKRKTFADIGVLRCVQAVSAIEKVWYSKPVKAALKAVFFAVLRRLFARSGG